MLRFQNITKRFSNQTVIDALDLELPFQGVTFIMGPSGAGKSVLAQLAVGLLRPDSGHIELDGVAIENLHERQWRARRAELGYVTQGPALLDWLTLRENVALGPVRVRRVSKREALERADAALAQVGLAEVADRRPSEVGPGTQKRTSVARALACGPRALVYDEPTTGLDPRSARQVDDLIADAARRGTAAIVVSHDLASAERTAQRTLVLHKGRVGYDGPASGLKASNSPAATALLERGEDG
ncbi:MAG: ATP-binding cassette domain-containing protein [Deltaproteobacteria bacterium]|nr:ATP-binding cassette domain-containing protein [Deltaproteobacteria bacterium]